MSARDKVKGTVTVLLIATIVVSMAHAVSALTIERPAGGDIDLRLLGRDENATTNGEVSVGLAMNTRKFYYDDNPDPYSSVRLNVSMTANSRIGINYTQGSAPYCWVNEADFLDTVLNVSGVSDDVMIPVNMSGHDTAQPFQGVRFYGEGISALSPSSSAVYAMVYISSNGFLSFDNSSQPSPIPSGIPNGGVPNTLIAATWSDLSMDNSSWMQAGIYGYFGYQYFVVIWNNALHKASGQRLTFEIMMEQAPGVYPVDTYCQQSRIWISWKNVSQINTNFAFGIEDQQGARGLGWCGSGSDLQNLNGLTYLYQQLDNSPRACFLKGLTMSFRDENSQTSFRMERYSPTVSGFHIQKTPSETEQPDPYYQWGTALAGSAIELIDVAEFVGVGVPVIVSGGGVIVGVVLCGLALADLLAYNQYSNRDVTIFDNLTGEGNNANVTGYAYDYSGDATLSTMVNWVLYDNDMGAHSLTITAILSYTDRYSNGTSIDRQWTTTLNVKIGLDNNNSFGTAEQIVSDINYTNRFLASNDPVDYYTLHTAQVSTIRVLAGASYPWGAGGVIVPIPDFYLYVYDPSGNRNPYSYHGYSHDLTITNAMAGDWYFETALFANEGFYWLEVNVTSGGGGGGGGGGGCPYVSAWNGSGYVLDNNILPGSEMSGGGDVKDYYRLEQPLVPVFQCTMASLYSLRISEFEHEHDYIDQVKLLAVDHAADVNVGVSPSGEILTYKNPAPPTSAIGNDGADVLSVLNASDDAYYEGYNGSSVTLTFAPADVSAGAKLVMKEDYPGNWKDPIYVQVLNSTGQWNTVTILCTRDNWATDVINMTGCLPDAQGSLRVRLYFTETSRIDYVGLDTTPQANVQVHQAWLLGAFSSSQGDVARLLSADDGRYAELLPGQQILLRFMLPTSRNSQRTFILYTEGHYQAIP